MQDIPLKSLPELRRVPSAVSGQLPQVRILPGAQGISAGQTRFFGSADNAYVIEMLTGIVVDLRFSFAGLECLGNY